MFDLEFYTTVCKMLSWTEDAPPVVFANDHQMSMIYKQKGHTQFFDGERGVIGGNALLCAYVTKTYVPYFGLKLNYGRHALLNRDRVYDW